MMRFPMILGHEVAATVVNAVPGDEALGAGTKVRLALHKLRNLRFLHEAPRERLRVQRNAGSPKGRSFEGVCCCNPEKIFPAALEQGLCLVEPLTVGFQPWRAAA